MSYEIMKVYKMCTMNRDVEILHVERGESLIFLLCITLQLNSILRPK